MYSVTITTDYQTHTQHTPFMSEPHIALSQSTRFRSSTRHPIVMFAVIIILFGNLKNIIIYNQGDKQEENDLTDICAWFKRLLCCWYYNVL